jgi:hypothetical protein
MNANTQLSTKAKKIEINFRKPVAFMPTLNNTGGVNTPQSKVMHKKLAPLTPALVGMS